MIDDSQLKNALMELWKDVFGDSDAYVSLVFDNYFKRDMVEFELRDGQVIAGLLGVPYRLRCGSKEVAAMYMCGLSTYPEFRRQGIMRRMIERFCERMKLKNFVFTFLISASEDLEFFYKKNDFFNVSKRYIRYKYIQFIDKNVLARKSVNSLSINKSIVAAIIDNYSSLEELDNKDDVSLLIKNVYKKYYQNTAVNFNNIVNTIFDIIELSRYINNRKLNLTDVIVLHSLKDIAIAIYENFISGGTILISRNNLGELDGALFCSNIMKRKAHISLLASDSEEKEDALILTLQNFYPDIDVVVVPVDSIISRSMIRILDRVAADDFGITDVDNNYVFRQQSLLSKNGDIKVSLTPYSENIEIAEFNSKKTIGISLMLE